MVFGGVGVAAGGRAAAARWAAVFVALAVAIAVLPATSTAQTVVQSTGPACADAPAGRYWDVAGPHALSIDCIGWWGVTTGTDPARYRPLRSVNRGQMAGFVARTLALTRGTVPSEPPDAFTDDDGTTHEHAIDQLTSLGIVVGDGSDAFRPRESVSRAQMATFLAHAWEARTGQPLPDGESSFHDIAEDVHRDNIEAIAAAGLTGGVGGGAYSPASPVTRAQMATFLARFIAKLVADGTTTSPADAPVPLPAPPPVFATTSSIALREPSPDVELIGFHEANHAGAQQLVATTGGTTKITLPSRGRSTPSRSAADVVAAPDLPVLSPVTGVVIRAGTYRLYCDFPDHYVAIAPDARPAWEVVVLHFEGLRVRAGDRVTAARTILGTGPRILPFASQVDRYSHARNWPHVHVEVRDPSVPNRGGGGC